MGWSGMYVTCMNSRHLRLSKDASPLGALALLNEWRVALIQLLTSTGLIALFEFWYKALWRVCEATAVFARFPEQFPNAILRC
jgi:hypothetical protein